MRLLRQHAEGAGAVSLTDTEKTEPDWLPCVGCKTWHYAHLLKRAKGFFWCVLCYPSPMEVEK